MAKTIIGRVRPALQGKWDQTKSYEILSWVKYDGILWQAVKDVPAMADPPSKDSEYWFAISSSDPENVQELIDSAIEPIQDTLTNDVVHKEGNEEISGIKTFTGDSVHGPTQLLTDNSDAFATTSFVQGLVAKIQQGFIDLDAHLIVSTENDQIINGVKTFTQSPLVPNVTDTADKSKKAANTLYVHKVIEAALEDLDADSGKWVKKVNSKLPTNLATIAGITEDMPIDAIVYFLQETTNPLYQVELDSETGLKKLVVMSIGGVDTNTKWIKKFDGKPSELTNIAEFVADIPNNGLINFTESDDTLVDDDNNTVNVDQFVSEYITPLQSAIEDEETGLEAIKTIADSALVKADAAATQTALNEVKATADNALPSSGGELSGSFLRKFNYLDFSTVADKSNDYYSLMAGYDKNNTNFFALRGWYWQTNSWATSASNQVSLTAYIPDETEELIASALGVIVYKDGTKKVSITENPEINEYSTQIATCRYCVDNFMQSSHSSITLYLGGANASDTAAINTGRGKTPDKPFAGLSAILNWISKYYASNYEIKIVLQDDYNAAGSLYYNLPSIYRIHLTSDSTKRKITFNQNTYINSGSLKFSNIKLHFNNVPQGLSVQGHYRDTHLQLDSDLEITGTVTQALLNAFYGGTIWINNSISGTVTGKKYSCTTGGKIFTNNLGASAIPGSVAGTCDDNSIFV